ncbi:hypothetical protein [Halegenticoccus tardaugens]|uniref:hypothetical protein n=1 Tax=Halegenticoccus tardaugens TaxID=2071624 RepID=UPI00100BD4F3|nr:hypothetical protein [Halegenticoccus tardaugens]
MIDRAQSGADREDSAARAREDDRRRASRRRILAGVGTVATVGLGGCLRTGLRASVDGLADSNVFEDVSPSGSVATARTTAKVTLTSAAATRVGVRELSVTSTGGSEIWTGSVAPGQTSVGGVVFPVGKPARLSAANYDGAFVEGVTVTIGGRAVP